jgi:hypothetical protein
MITPAAYASGRLELRRADFAQALKIVARAMSKCVRDVGFTFEDGFLSIEAGETVAKAPASGFWSVPVFVVASWVQLMARKLPFTDPVALRIEQGRIFFGGCSDVFSLTPRKYDPDSELPQSEVEKAIVDAAKILKPFLIEQSELENLVSRSRAAGVLPGLGKRNK